MTTNNTYLRDDATFSGIGRYGTAAYSPVYVYDGADTNALIVATRGTVGPPVTDSGATVVFQSVGAQTTGSGTTLYASWLKETTTAFVGGRPAWFEATDPVGGTNSFVEGLRSSSYLSGGTGGNTVGIVSLAIAAAGTAALACVGLESQTFNLDTAKTTAFSNVAFAASFLATCGQAAGNSADAGFMTNPFSNAPFITGFFVPAGGPRQSVSDTAFRCDGSVVNGLDLTRGTYSGFSIAAPSFRLDSSGNMTAAALINGSNPLTIGSSTGVIKFGTSGAFAANGTNGLSFTASVGPNAAVGTAIAKWWTFLDPGGVVSYIPVWQ